MEFYNFFEVTELLKRVSIIFSSKSKEAESDPRGLRGILQSALEEALTKTLLLFKKQDL